MILQPLKQGILTTGGGKLNSPWKNKGQTENEGTNCSHSENSKHTHETCLKLHGYPYWCHELKARKQK